MTGFDRDWFGSIPLKNAPKGREWYFRGMFLVPCGRGNLDVRLVLLLAYFGLCGVFCSVVGSWVLKPLVAVVNAKTKKLTNALKMRRAGR